MAAHVELEPDVAIPTSVRICRGVEFDQALAWQREAVNELRRDRDAPQQLYLIEHAPVVTLGRSGDGRHLRMVPSVLEEQGIAYRETDRGGDVTYHGPGQWTMYPILHLGRFCRDLHRYLRLLEEVGLRFLRSLGIKGRRREGRTGVWVERDKIAAAGVGVRGWVSFHGMAVNIAPDLDPFRRCIVPCGIEASEGGVTSLAELMAHPPDMDRAAELLVDSFFHIFPFPRGEAELLLPPSGTNISDGADPVDKQRASVKEALSTAGAGGSIVIRKDTGVETAAEEPAARGRSESEGDGGRTRFPPWLRKRVPSMPDGQVKACLGELGLDTVCTSARCPNRAECYHKGRATFLLMGPSCTRRCRFCAVDRNAPAPLDTDEPERVAEAVERLGLRHAVITSVTRDDLPDGGAEHFAKTVAAVRRRAPKTTVEILVPDFAGDWEAWAVSIESGPDVFNHNLETVPRLYRHVRLGAEYERSLDLLRYAKERRPELTTKSGLMLGLGETTEEVLEVARDLRGAAVDMLTVGQYLCPRSSENLPVARFVPPEEFDRLGDACRLMGFRFVAAAPFVRSSYNAAEAFDESRSLPA